MPGVALDRHLPVEAEHRFGYEALDLDLLRIKQRLSRASGSGRHP